MSAIESQLRTILKSTPVYTKLGEPNTIKYDASSGLPANTMDNWVDNWRKLGPFDIDKALKYLNETIDEDYPL
jgi:hypothetical protein